MDIREMKAGRELDALVAEKVMGFYIEWQKFSDNPEGIPPYINPDPGGVYQKDCPQYSTDISAAWEVVEKMNQRNDAAFGHYLSECIGLTTGMDAWVKGNMPFSYSLAGWVADLTICELMEKLTPEKICIAALLAMDDKI